MLLIIATLYYTNTIFNFYITRIVYPFLYPMTCHNCLVRFIIVFY